MNDSAFHPDSQPSGNDHPLFLRLYSKHQQRLFAYLFTLIPNRVDAEDLLQEVSITLWEKFDTFEPGTDFMAWAMRVSFLKVQNARRRYARSPLVLDDDLLKLISDQVASMRDEFDARHDALASCLQKLSNRDRELVIARYQPNASVKQLARDIDRPVKAVYKTLARIRQDLQDCITMTIGGRSS